jgi:hypothetical protein
VGFRAELFMKTAAESSESRGDFRTAAEEKDEKRKLVLAELEAVLASPTFRSAARCKQFLEFVVQHELNGHHESLKERTIGTEVFHRPAGYATGDDPVVRVQAGEVRRRLEHHYQAAPNDSPVRIELPVGSYAPVFQWRPPTTENPAADSAAVKPHSTKGIGPRARVRIWFVAAAALVLIAMGAVVAVRMDRAVRQKTAVDRFWAPVFASQQPVLICLAKPVVYRPTQSLYQRYAHAHPGTFGNESQRTSEPLPLHENDQISWGDMYLASDFGVALGDAYAAVDLSGLLGRIAKPSQVRIGANYSFEDLRNSPAVIVGAFNNKWTMQLMSNLHFGFVEDHEDFSIRELPPGDRVWRTHFNRQGQTTDDFAIVARLLNSKTGQFTVTVAGIGGAGTQAAGEFVSSAQSLEEALRSAPVGWQTKNLEFVLETSITESVPGPAHVVASYYW